MTRTIVFVLFEDAEELDWVGPWEAFGALSQLEPGSCKLVAVSHDGQPVKGANGLRVLVDASFAESPKADLVVIPGGVGTVKASKDPQVLDFVRSQVGGAEAVTSVCTGAFVLAGAGLLEGRRATTYWASLPALRQVPGVTVVEERWVDNGDILTGGGVTAGIDMALHLIGRLWSPETARRVQQAIEYFPAPPYGDVPIPEKIW
jgi:transcriptional regulator GlxA family with amidase domain